MHLSLLWGKKKKKRDKKKISTMHIFCGDKALQIPLAQDQQSSPVPRVKATLAFDPNLQHLQGSGERRGPGEAAQALRESSAEPASRAEPRSGQQPWKLGSGARTPAAWRGRAAPENKREKQKEVKKIK